MKTHTMTQRSDEWLQVKKGKVSGTQLKDLMGTPLKQRDAIYDILGESLKTGIDNNDYYESPMERGNRLEPEARAAYEALTGLEVREVGFLESDAHERVGNSPDGLVGEHGAIEIKCPEHKNYMKYWLDIDVVNFTWTLNMSIPEEYIWQIVQYFVVNEKLQWLDFVAYNPDIPVHPIHVIRVTREELAEKMKQAEDKEAVFVTGINKLLGSIVEF